MLDDIRAGAVDAVVVWHLDRLHRQPKELEEFFEVCDAAGLTALASVTGDIDLVDPRRPVPGAYPRRRGPQGERRQEPADQPQAPGARAGGQAAGGGDSPIRLPRRPADGRADRGGRDPRGCRAHSRGRQPPRRRVRLERPRRARFRRARGPSQVLRRMLMSPAAVRPARLPGRDRRNRRVGADHHPRRDAQLRAILGDPARTTRRTVRRYLLSGGLLACAICARRRSSPDRGATATRRYVCAKGPGCRAAAGSRSSPTRRRADRRGGAVPARHARARRRAGRCRQRGRRGRGRAGRGRAADRASSTSSPARTASGRSRSPSTSPRGSRSRPGSRPRKRKVSRLTQTTAIAGYVGDGAALRERLGGPAADPSAGDRRRGARPRGRPPGRPRPDTLRPRPRRARLARSDRAAPRARLDRDARSRDLGRHALRRTGPLDPRRAISRRRTSRPRRPHRGRSVPRLLVARAPDPLGRCTHVRLGPADDLVSRRAADRHRLAAGSPARPRTDGARRLAAGGRGPCRRTSRGSGRRAAPRRACPSRPAGRRAA